MHPSSFSQAADTPMRNSQVHAAPPGTSPRIVAPWNLPGSLPSSKVSAGTIPFRQTVVLQSGDGKFLSVQGLEQKIVPQASGEQAAHFEIVDAGGGYIAFQSHLNQLFLTVSGNGQGLAGLCANQAEMGNWERFTWIENEDGTISLLARANNKLVGLNVGGGTALVANERCIGSLEKFFVFPIGPVPSRD